MFVHLQECGCEDWVGGKFSVGTISTDAHSLKQRWLHTVLVLDASSV